MKKYFKESLYRLTILLVGILLGSSLFVSCVDENSYANKEPEWLGASIYDYLQTGGNYKTYVKLIDELGYTETLKKTGSKTLFVANDSAFTEFFKSNAWGVTSYEQLTLAQKKIIFNYCMINNAYTSDQLSNYNNGTLQTGAAMRRETAISIYDSIPHDFGDQLPNGLLWDKYKTRGIYLLKDNTSWPLVHFTQKELDQAQISDDDFNFLTGSTRVKDDLHVFG
ncbi:MAG: fasciclin domain-containing protein, partial [Paludibacter sp.]